MSAAATPEKRARNAWLRTLAAIQILDDPTVTLPSLLPDLAEKHGDAPALIGLDNHLTYKTLAAAANRAAHWAETQPAGATIALFMPNSPDYAAIWLGITATGRIAALLNTNLTGPALTHAIKAANATLVISDPNLRRNLPPETEILTPAIFANFPDTAPHIANLPDAAATALLIYTSGTTGLPKAATLPHRRLVEWSFWFAGMMDAQPTDRLFNCLPMYHSTGGVVAIGAMLVSGGAVIIRPRFSASTFWSDIAQTECTIFQYIGELCRYLNNTPAQPHETNHKLRLACGNGLTEDVWKTFQSRFKIPDILEFYAATEGAVSLYNAEAKPGAIGRVPPYLAHRFGPTLIAIDPETNTPIRDANGRCIPAATGEAIGKLSNIPAFYTDPTASEKKILRNVFEPGDIWFRTGDLMRKDAGGFYYFVDRLGDTYRWKAENVATTEVAAIIAACPGVTQAIVYGVSIPHHEGRAGMAAITITENFDPATLITHIETNLPAYAQPLFIRICATLEITGTFKPIKSRLATESYTNSPDPIWFHDRRAKTLIPCDATLRENLQTGSIKL
jgi:fatty-acyl-CoA synthase